MNPAPPVMMIFKVALVVPSELGAETGLPFKKRGEYSGLCAHLKSAGVVQLNSPGLGGCAMLTAAVKTDEEVVIPKRVEGLDQLRFFLALWVAFDHVGFLPFLGSVGIGTPAGRLFGAFFHNVVSGPAAVIVFFVISGFCIHFPYRRSRSLALVPFFARRHIRILVPAICAAVIAKWLGIVFANLDKSILWSLVCEEIYYALYPIVLRLRWRFGFRPLLVASFVAAYLLVALTPRGDGNYPDLGWRFTWILGYPCWLLGAQLAEVFDSADSRNILDFGWNIWWFRFVIWALSWTTSALRFHSPLHYRWTLDLFAIAVYVWLRHEIRWANRRKLGVFERAGAFSYSLYLMHLQGDRLWKTIVSSWNSAWLWPLEIGFILACSYVFYRLIERPAHHLARQVQRRVSRAVGT